MRAPCLLVLALTASCSSVRWSVAPENASPGDGGRISEVLTAAHSLEQDFREIARRSAPSIVTVRAYVKSGTEKERPADSPEIGWSGETANSSYFGYELYNAASGFVIDPSGEILTCYHALQRANGTPVDLIDIETNDGSRILVDVLGAEPTVNFAILRCSVFPASHPGTLPALRFGDSDAMECGRWAIGIGDPAGPERFFAPGTFVSKPSRECYQDYLSAFYLQVAMVAPPQAYGGPLLDVDGDVVGILAPRGFSPGSKGDAVKTGIELALPTEIVKGLHQAIRKAGSIQSPWLGFSVMSRAEIANVRGVDVVNALAKPKNGILIENVFTPSVASAAGIQRGDFLVGFDTFKVFQPVDFQRYLYLAGIGTKVKLEVFRNGETLTKELVIERRPPEAQPR